MVLLYWTIYDARLSGRGHFYFLPLGVVSGLGWALIVAGGEEQEWQKAIRQTSTSVAYGNSSLHPATTRTVLYFSTVWH